jgi:NAD(P)-dependent dehydrogenase (short-subunit alcohol dehydrogenase family)
MPKEVQAKVALASGRTSGIGREASVLFAKAGANVAASGHRKKEGNETIGLIRTAGGDGLFVKSRRATGILDSATNQLGVGPTINC